MSYEDLIQIPSFLASSIKQTLTSSSTYAHVCESSCQLRCEKSVQCSGCQGVCEHPCMSHCQSGQCGSCESTCEDQGPCIGGQCGNAEWCGGCEDGCQDCQSSCQNSCQDYQGPKVTCTKVSYFYNNNGSILVTTSSESEGGLIPGYSFTPGQSSHMPSYDSSKYSLYQIKYNGNTISTSSSITCPSSNFTVYYYFRRILTIDKWDWDSSNGSASISETKAAYIAITEKGLVSNFSFKVWNDMCNKVVEIHKAHGSSSTWNSTYLSYEDTKMDSTDKTLTAERFNSLRFNIGNFSSTGISDVSSGDIVLGSYFLTLADSLNTWIDKWF